MFPLAVKLKEKRKAGVLDGSEPNKQQLEYAQSCSKGANLVLMCTLAALLLNNRALFLVVGSSMHKVTEVLTHPIYESAGVIVHHHLV